MLTWVIVSFGLFIIVYNIVVGQYLENKGKKTHLYDLGVTHFFSLQELILEAEGSQKNWISFLKWFLLIINILWIFLVAAGFWSVYS